MYSVIKKEEDNMILIKLERIIKMIKIKINQIISPMGKKLMKKGIIPKNMNNISIQNNMQKEKLKPTIITIEVNGSNSDLDINIM